MNELLTVRQLADRHKAFSEPSIRALILNAEDRQNSRGERIPGNGLAEAGAIVRVGRRVLIDEQIFLAWARGTTSPKKGMNGVLRYEILKRDRFACVSCGITAARGAVLHVDHKIPKALGGESSFENLQTLCEQCNLGKGAR